MGQWTIVIHGTGAHHNWATEKDPEKTDGTSYITGRLNDYDADLMFAEFVDALKAKGHSITGATITFGGMNGDEAVVRRDYVNQHLPAHMKSKAGAPQPSPRDVLIKHMVDRFLQWRLPSPWHPDGGVSFEGTINAGTPHQHTYQPTGTNLFDATQAEAMVRHMLEGAQ